MKKKKKFKKKKPSPSLTVHPGAQELITSIMKDLKTTDHANLISRLPDARHAQILIEHLSLEDASCVPFMMAIQESFQDKDVRKAVNRVLFKLKNKGLLVGDGSPNEGQSQSVLKPPKHDKPTALIGPIDSFGFRTVLVSLQRSMKGLEVGIGLVSDDMGMQEFLFGTFSKKRTKEIKEQLSQDAGPLIDTSLSHATTVLEEAYKRHLELHPDPPADYLQMRPKILDMAPLLKRPPIYEALSGDLPEDKTLTDSQIRELFDHDLMKSWIVDLEQLKPFVEEIHSVEKSPILLTEIQKEERTLGIKEKAFEALYPEDKQRTLKHRLEEMAYFFLKLGEEKFAQLSHLAALVIKNEGSPPKRNPVLWFILERSFDLYMEGLEEMREEEEKGSSSNLILPQGGQS